MLSTLVASLFAFVGGALLWSFAEYTLHRFWGHEARGKNEFSREHLRHHAEDGYFTPTPKKLLTAVPIAALFFGGLGYLLGVVGIALSVGFFAAYTTYEVMHYRLHITPPRNAYGRWARRHHFGHHFNCPKMNHGVTSPIWDVVFRTNQPIDKVRVPKRRAPASMPWLVDEQGELRPELAGDFTLVGR
ncbi:MAG: sterol desaturase family protein [Myxococcales bacterium]|nr:sterol desaturase family protein [Myxococcales bacterium]